MNESLSPAPVPTVIVEALAAQRVIAMEYRDRHGVLTAREVEPMGYVGGSDHWYLLAWCRERDALRAFRLDRIASAVATREVVKPRPLGISNFDLPAMTPPDEDDDAPVVSRPVLTLVR